MRSVFCGVSSAPPRVDDRHLLRRRINLGGRTIEPKDLEQASQALRFSPDHAREYRFKLTDSTRRKEKR